MKRSITLLVAVLAAAMTMATMAQDRKSLRINEVMVVNDSSIVDDFGEHHAWIELFNANFAPLEISSMYLTNDKNNPTKYPIPLGDVNTRIPKRQHVIFWADNKPNNGTFHISFTLTPGQDNWIGLYDSDRKTLVDSVTVPANLAAGHSYARSIDGAGEWMVRDGSDKDYITPSSANVIKDKNPKVDEFAEKDSAGVLMTVMAMGIVFIALFVLSLCFVGIGAISKYFARSNKAKAKGVEVVEIDRKDLDSGETIAAIVMALHEHLDVHDTESTVLTINKVKRAYSPWSSKIYGLRELPHK